MCWLQIFLYYFLSTKAGGLGIDLIGANRAIIFDASWNPSNDVIIIVTSNHFSYLFLTLFKISISKQTQSVFRVYRLGQTKKCHIYRFTTLGTMEEAIYKRQVTKILLSKRVVDELQIDRHFKRSDLEELYSTENIELMNNDDPIELPRDHILSKLMMKYENIIYRYQYHDSLLKNKEDENLSAQERELAWDEYEKFQGMASQDSIQFPCLQIGNDTMYYCVFSS